MADAAPQHRPLCTVTFPVELEGWDDLDRTADTPEKIARWQGLAESDVRDAVAEYADGDVDVVWEFGASDA